MRVVAGSAKSMCVRREEMDGALTPVYSREPTLTLLEVFPCP